MSGQNTHLDIAAEKSPNVAVCFRTVPLLGIDTFAYLFPLAKQQFKTMTLCSDDPEYTYVAVKIDWTAQFGFLTQRPLWKIQCMVCTQYKCDTTSFSTRGVPIQCTDCSKTKHGRRFCPRSLVCYDPSSLRTRECCGLCEWHEVVNRISW